METDSRKRAFVGFGLDDRFYAVPLNNVVRATRMVAVTPIPNTPSWFAGIISWHGQTTPAFDLRSILGLSPKPLSLTDRLLFVHRAGRTCAFLAGEDIHVISVPASSIDPVSEFELHPRPVNAVLATDDRTYLALDLDGLFASIPELLDEPTGIREGGGNGHGTAADGAH